MMSAVSGVDLWLLSSISTEVVCAEAMHLPSENTPWSKVTDALDGLVVSTPERQA